MFVPFSCSLALAAAPEVVALSADRGGETVLPHTSGALAGLPFDTWIDRADPRVVELAKVGVFVDPWGGIKFRPRATTPPTGEVVLPYRTPTGGGSRTLTWKVREVDAPPFAPTLGLAPGSELIVDLRPLDDAGAVSPPTLTVDDPQVTVTCEDWSCRLAAKPKTKGRLKYRVADAGGAWAEGALIVGPRGKAPIAAPPMSTVEADQSLTLKLAQEADTSVVVTRGPIHGQLLLNDRVTLTYRPDPGFAGRDSVEYVVRGPWGTTQRLTAPIEITGTPTARRPDDRPLPAHPVDGRLVFDVAHEAISGYPAVDEVHGSFSTGLTIVGTKVVIDLPLNPEIDQNLTLLRDHVVVGTVKVDTSNLRADDEWCSAAAQFAMKQSDRAYLLCVDTASDRRRATMIHERNLGAETKAPHLAHPEAPIVLAVRTRGGPPELKVTSDDSTRSLGEPRQTWITTSPSGPSRAVHLYVVHRDNPVGVTTVTARVTDDEGTLERAKHIVTRKPTFDWRAEHVLLPSVVADPTLVPPGTRLVTDPSLVAVMDGATFLTTADLISSDFYVVRVGVRGAVGLAEADGEPVLGVLSIPTTFDPSAAFNNFAAGGGVWATFPLAADDWRRGTDTVERRYNLSLGGRLGLDPLRVEDQVPFQELFLEGMATMASFEGAAITLKGKGGVAYASQDFRDQLALDHRTFGWFVIRAGLGMKGGPAIAVQRSAGPVEGIASGWSVVLDLGR